MKHCNICNRKRHILKPFHNLMVCNRCIKELTKQPGYDIPLGVFVRLSRRKSRSYRKRKIRPQSIISLNMRDKLIPYPNS